MLWFTSYCGRRQEVASLSTQVSLYQVLNRSFAKPKKCPPQTKFERIYQYAKEIEKELRAENSRDRERVFLDLYDRSYRKILTGVSLMATGVFISSLVFGASSIVYLALLAISSGLGLSRLALQLTYFLKGKNNYQDERLPRDMIDEAATKLEVYNKIRDIRKLKPMCLTEKEMRKLLRVCRNIYRITDRMERRDRQQKRPGQRTAALVANELALKRCRDTLKGTVLGPTLFNELILKVHFPQMLEQYRLDEVPITERPKKSLTSRQKRLRQMIKELSDQSRGFTDLYRLFGEAVAKRVIPQQEIIRRPMICREMA